MAQPQDEISAKNEDEGSCGVGCCYFKFLHKFASKKSYVIVYGLTGSLYLALSTYFVGTISTLEKRFQIPSLYIGMINSACDVGVIFTTLTASYLGKSSHKTRWVAFGTALVGLSCFVRLIPHWLYGSGINALQLTKEFSAHPLMINGSTENAGEKVYLCGGKQSDHTENCVKSQTGNIAAFLFLMAHMMQGVGSSVYYTLGIAYLDDNARKTKVPLLLAISQCLRMIGPTFGYIFASYAVGKFIEPNVTPLISDVDPRWVGAWWLGWGPMGTCCLVLSLCMAMFPKTLPRTALRKLNNDIAERQQFVEQQRVPELSIKDFRKTVARLLKNKVLVCNSISSVCFTFGFLGQWIFLPKYMETQFHKSPSEVSFISGAFGLLFTAAGMLVSATVISKFQPSARKLAGWNIFTEILDCLAFVAILFVGCSSSSSITALKTQDFENGCSFDCHCPDNTPFSPICQAQQSFFSPCHAGCSSVNSTFSSKYFENCSCAEGSEPAVDGLCPVDCAQAFAIFVLIHCIQRFFGATGRAGNTLIHFRCVSPEDKPVSVGLLEFMLCAFAFIPAPLVYGYLIDNACLIWGENCGVQGNCWVYDVEKLRFYVNLPILGCIMLGTLWDIGVWYYVGQLPMYDEEADNKQNVPMSKRNDDLND